jgi:hypothetical protein
MSLCFLYLIKTVPNGFSILCVVVDILIGLWGQAKKFEDP